MPAGQGLQATGRPSTSNPSFSNQRHVMLKPHHVCSSQASSLSISFRHQAQPQRHHAQLQRCQSTSVVAQSASGSSRATHTQQQAAVVQQPDAQQQSWQPDAKELQQQQQQQQQQHQQQQQQQQQQRSPLFQLPPQGLQELPSKRYSSSAESSSSSNEQRRGASEAAAGKGGLGAAAAGSVRDSGGADVVSSSSAHDDTTVLGTTTTTTTTSSSSSSSSIGAPQVMTTASPASITWSISNARSIDQLAAVVSLYRNSFNCIHTSAAFMQLQRLWPQTTASSSSSIHMPPSDAAAAVSEGDEGWLSPSSSSSSSTSEEVLVGRWLLLQLQALALKANRIDTRFVANVLYSLAVLHHSRGEQSAYNAALVNKLCAAAYSCSNNMPPQELATLAWSLARLEVVPAPALLRRLVSNVLRQLGRFGAQDLFMTLSALPSLHHQSPGVVAPYATVHKLAAAAGPVLPAASAHEAAGILAALGALQWRAPPGWLQAYWAAVLPKVQDMGWEQLAMTGWALGQLAPLSAAPPAAWLDTWQEAVLQRLLVAADGGRHHNNNSSSSSSSSGGGGGVHVRVPLVELVMVLYGWSKALPDQPPTEQLQQLVFSTTQEAMSRTGRSSSSLSLAQQQRQQQQLPGLQEGLQQQAELHATVQQQQQQLQQQPHHQATPNLSSSSSSGSGLSLRLLAELVSCMARWQLLPPRQWLLSLLTNTQQQLVRGGCSLQDISNILWGLASLGVRPKSAWLDLTAAAAEQQMHAQTEAITALQRQQQDWQRQRTEEWLSKQRRGGGGVRKGAVQQQQQQQAIELGQHSSQQLHQHAALPKQLAVLLWSLDRLQHRPASSFWQQFWAVSSPLLPRVYPVHDLAMTLDAVVRHQQQPPQEWLTAALTAATYVHMRHRRQRGPGATTSSSSSSSSSSRAHHQQQQPPQAAQPQQLKQQQQQQQQFCGQVVRMVAGFARLGVKPGQQWCVDVLSKVLQPVAGHLTVQDVSQLLWALGTLGYRPAGRVLPPWLHQQLQPLLTPLSSSSSSSSSGSGTSSGALPGCVFSGLSESQCVMLLVGLRRCRVVPAGPWLLQLLTASGAVAADLTPQVFLQLVAYTASTGISPPPTWTAAIVDALPGRVQAQRQLEDKDTQQQQQQPPLQQQPAGQGELTQQVWLLSLLAHLRRLRVELSPEVCAQLEQAAMSIAPTLQPDTLKHMQRQLRALQTGFTHPRSAHQQQQHQQLLVRSNGGALVGVRGADRHLQQQQQQQQQYASQGVRPSAAAGNGGDRNSSSSSSRRHSTGSAHVPGGGSGVVLQLEAAVLLGGGNHSELG